MPESYRSAGSDRLRHRALFFLLYFCEGAPIGFLWWALPVVLVERGVGDAETGLLIGLLTLPWALKFLWAPMVDVLRGPRLGLRAWIGGAQVLMVLSLAPLAWLGSDTSVHVLGGFLLLHAFAAATQDVAVDALAIQSTPRAEFGDLNGWMQAGMLCARTLFGGGFLLVRGHVGDRVGVAVLMGTIALGALLAFAVPTTAFGGPAPPRTGASGLRAAARGFGGILRAALARRSTWVALLFAATAGAGFEAVGAFAGRLLRARGLELADIGWQFAAQAGLLALGALVGGRLSDRLGRRRATAGAGLLLALSVFALAGLAGSSPDSSNLHLLVALEIVYVCIGLFTAASYGLFMEATDPRLGSTQFSAYMGATNLCEAWAAAAAGVLIASRGHAVAFGSLACVSLLALLLLPLIESAPASDGASPQ